MKVTVALIGMFACIVCSVGAVAQDAVGPAVTAPANAPPAVEPFASSPLIVASLAATAP